MSEAVGYSVILVDRGSPDPMALAKVLAAIRGTPVQDQMLAARSAWGIVAEDLEGADAKALREALRSSGIESAVGPMAALVELPPVEVVSTLDALPAAEPVLIAVAGLTVTTTTTRKVDQGPSPGQKAASAAIMMSTGLPIKVGGKKKTVQKTREEQSLVFQADLCYDEPPRRLRIDASHFDFSCLEARMVYHAQANLKLVMGDLVQAAPRAWLNHGARVLLEGRPIRTMGYRSVDDLEREARWLLTLRKHGI